MRLLGGGVVAMIDSEVRLRLEIAAFTSRRSCCGKRCLSDSKQSVAARISRAQQLLLYDIVSSSK